MKKAIVTGASSGIGRAVAERLLREGWQVFGMSRRSLERLGDLAERENFTYVQGDVSKDADRLRLVECAGEVDALVNVAGIAPRERRDILEMTEESYDEVMNVNTKGTLFLTQGVARGMIKRGGGAIVNISSISAYTSSTSRAEYCISKAGVSMITQLFADRLAEYGITVNEVRPGIIRTDMTEGVVEKYDRLIENGLLPIKRWGTPEDVAEAVWMLVNGSLPYTTGESISVDGGFLIRRL
ncbi:MAG: 3-ketoacyl-ACP reductase [Clostridia bacterium]|nr:3-ketoacyl-ACP reductase [Clostridia bacterium]